MKNTFKSVFRTVALATVLTAPSVFAEVDENGWATTYSSLSAFDDRILFYGDRVAYVKPIINNLGNVLNSNWYVSANVPSSMTFEAGLPFSIIPVGDDDRKYSRPMQADGLKGAPTIFGDHAKLETNPFTGVVEPNYADPVVYGNETLNGLGIFTYPYLQLGASFFHARVVLRGMILPSISELQKFNLFGFGLQYSFGHFFQYMLPHAAQGLNASLVYGYSTSGIGYRPDKYEGSLDLDISAHTFDLVIGYKPVNFVEVMMTLGYQCATMESSGYLYQENKNPDGSKTAYNEIRPNISVDGNDGFKFGIAVAFQLGTSYHPVLGYDYAGKSSFTTNILYFRQQFGTDKTPDEIAKEKGYVRGAKADKTETKQNEEKKETSKKRPLETDEESNDDFESESN